MRFGVRTSDRTAVVGGPAALVVTVILTLGIVGYYALQLLVLLAIVALCVGIGRLTRRPRAQFREWRRRRSQFWSDESVAESERIRFTRPRPGPGAHRR